VTKGAGSAVRSAAWTWDHRLLEDLLSGQQREHALSSEAAVSSPAFAGGLPSCVRSGLRMSRESGYQAGLLGAVNRYWLPARKRSTFFLLPGSSMPVPRPGVDELRILRWLSMVAVRETGACRWEGCSRESNTGRAWTEPQDGACLA
jgi:hypothetical protein